jgi:hypothetical protein
MKFMSNVIILHYEAWGEIDWKYCSILWVGWCGKLAVFWPNSFMEFWRENWLYFEPKVAWNFGGKTGCILS